MEIAAQPHTTWQDLTLPLAEVIRLAKRMLVGLALVAFLPFVMLWGLPSFLPSGDWLSVLGRAFAAVGLFTIAYLLSAVVHEGLHAFAMLIFAGISPRAIRFGVRLSEGVAYVHADRPMTVRAYRRVLALPALLQGVLPLLAGLAIGSGWLTLYGYVMLVSAAGDVAVLRLLRPYDGDRLVRDHPDDVGCLIAVEG